MRIKTKPVKYVSWELAKPGKYHYNPQRTIEDFIEWAEIGNGVGKFVRHVVKKELGQEMPGGKIIQINHFYVINA